MALDDNERLQEMVLVTEDKLSLINRRWWYALLFIIVAAAPLYLLSKSLFISLAVKSYQTPELIYVASSKQPLQITEKGIFDLGNKSYSAYVKIKNIEYDWGVASQNYTAEFKTLGGTSITKVTGSVFILPSSEKVLVLSRFSAEQKPEQLVFTLGETHFIHRPQFEFNYELERKTVQIHGSEYVVSAGIKNLTPFTIKRINLPVAMYDNKNKIVAVNFTSIDEVKSGETRTFQYTPMTLGVGNVRPEITPEVNVFDRDVFQIEPGTPSF